MIQKIAHSLKTECIKLKSRNIWKLFRLQPITSEYYAFSLYSKLFLKMIQDTHNNCSSKQPLIIWNYQNFQECFQLSKYYFNSAIDFSAIRSQYTALSAAAW